ncbi:MAG: hypothetical protein ACLPX5_16430 [Dissulfurispiraceae bacterium]
MIDVFYLKSFFLTLTIYLILVGALVAFVVMTGIVGFFLMFLIIVLLVAYFYGWFRRIDFIKKGLRS